MSDRHAEGIEKAAEDVGLLGLPASEVTRELRMDHQRSVGGKWRDIARATVTAYLDTAFPEVDSVEGLDALPVGVTIICADGWPWLHDSDGEGTWWWERAGSEEGFTSDEIPLPARVIHWGAHDLPAVLPPRPQL